MSQNHESQTLETQFRAMPRIAFWFLLIGALTSAACTAQRQHPGGATSSGGVLHPLQDAYDVIHYGIDLSVMPDRRAIAGSVDVTVDVLADVERFLLDLDDRLSVRRVFEEGKGEVEFTHDDGRLSITPSSPLVAGSRRAFTIAYGGEPRVAPNPPWIGGFTWEETEEGHPWVATSVQMDGADLWLPVKDHPSDKPDSVTIRITVPKPLVVASNGVLRNQHATADSTTFEWFTAQPISNYNIALNIAPYETIDTTYVTVDGVELPATFWVLPERLDDGRRMMPHFLDQLRWFEETIGPYPFRAEKYGVAHTPHLGMEHQTIIAYGSTFSMNRWGFDWLHQHELAHEWWSNLVTAADWKDFWIHEGFGTYMQALYTEHLRGEDAYREEMQTYRRTISNLKPIAPREPQTTAEMYFAEDDTRSDNDIYYKGSWVLHSLRFLMGDVDFFEMLRRFAYPTDAHRAATDGSQVRLVDTGDLIDIVNEVAGDDLTWFFEVYVRRAALPKLSVRRQADQLQITWEVAGGLAFPMPVEIAVNGARQRHLLPGGHATIDLPSDARVEVDPDAWLLRD